LVFFVIFVGLRVFVVSFPRMYRSDSRIPKRPAETRINNGDLDPHRDFVITIRPAR